MSDSITLDGRDLNHAGREGVWKITSIEGWWDSAKTRDTDQARVNGDGDIPGLIYFEPRDITITGRVIAKNHEYMHEAMKILTALSFRKYSKLVVSGHGQDLWASVRINGQVGFTIKSDKYLQFVIPLVAVDPFKYGRERSADTSLGTSVEVFQRGTVPAWPILTVSGSAPGGYAVSLGGRLVRVTAPLVSGIPHTLDMRTGMLRASGSRVYSGIAEAEYFSVPPGLPSVLVTSLNTTGSGTVQADFYDTYI